MSLYFRKSINVGPLRFNLSGSGVGVSTGVKGFRIGTGPRGNYVHVGRGGVYFRQTLPSGESRQPAFNVPEKGASGIVMEEIDSGSVQNMVDSSSIALLEEINSKAKKLLIWPWILTGGILLTVVLCGVAAGIWIDVLAIVLTAVALIWGFRVDKMRKTVVIFYQLEPHIEAAYQRIHDSFQNMRNCKCVWHIGSKGNIITTHDWKVNAGASAVVDRKQILPNTTSPPYFETNISLPMLPAGRQRLFFLPDRVLVWDTNGVGAVGYDQLQVDYKERRFIEEDSVPADSKVVGSTWKYVNKKGGPDRRFKDNREIPIALYEEILLISNTGLRELFQTSKVGIGFQLVTAFQEMASAIAQPAPLAPQTGFLKCPCDNCGTHIEFPAESIGQTVTCPSCGMQTVLFDPHE